MKVPRLLLLVFATFLATSPVRAQVKVEVAKITCEQFLVFSVADPKDIAIWLSGYYNGKRGSATFEPQAFKANFEKIKSACFKRENSKLPVMQVIEKNLGDSR
jgi:acid stress chaperone HdeB